MAYRLAENVQVRKESWGLLFYHQKRHKVLFVKSGDWLYPEHFDGTWTYSKIIDDISRRTGKTPDIIANSLSQLTLRLTDGKLITDEVY